MTIDRKKHSKSSSTYEQATCLKLVGGFEYCDSDVRLDGCVCLDTSAAYESMLDHDVLVADYLRIFCVLTATCAMKLELTSVPLTTTCGMK